MKNKKGFKYIVVLSVSLFSILSMSGCGSSPSNLNLNTVTIPNETTTEVFEKDVKLEMAGDINETTSSPAYNASTNVSELTSERIVYGEVSGEFSWAFDPSIQNNLLKDGAFVAKIKVISSQDALFVDENYLLDPVTPYKIEILGNYGDVLSEGVNTIYTSGGFVPVTEFMNHADADTISKFELDKIAKSQRDSYYINYTSEYDYDLIPGEEYIVILNKSSENGEYYISCREYGVFKKTNISEDESDFVNVITGKSFEFN